MKTRTMDASGECARKNARQNAYADMRTLGNSRDGLERDWVPNWIIWPLLVLVSLAFWGAVIYGYMLLW